jgi:hypothetical protein
LSQRSKTIKGSRERLKISRSNLVLWLYIATGVVCLGVCIAAAGRRQLEWTNVYVPAGARLLSSENLYLAGDPFCYPPFSAVVAVPFVWLPMWISNMVFQLVSFAAMILFIRASWQLSGGGRFPEERDKFQREIWIAILALLCAFRFSSNALAHGQSDLLIGLLLVLGAAALVNGRSALAGICWGLGAAFKGPPLLLVLYLVWRRQVAATVTMLAVFFAANLLPDVIHHVPGEKFWLAVWFERYLEPIFERSHPPGVWFELFKDNQSIAGVVGRWFSTSLTTQGKELVLFRRADAPNPDVLKIITYGIYGLLAIGSAIVMWPPFRQLKSRFDHASVVDTERFHRSVYEVAISLCLVPLVSPMTSRSHFCVLLLPAMCLARVTVDRRDGIVRTSFFIAIALSLISYNIPSLTLVHQFTLYLGFPTATALSLLIGCGWMRWKLERRSPS